MYNILSPKGMCSESRDLFTFWEISDNVSETVKIETYSCNGRLIDKNSSGDEIANFLTTISHTRRPTSKYRKRDKPTSFNKLDDR